MSLDSDGLIIFQYNLIILQYRYKNIEKGESTREEGRRVSRGAIKGIRG